MVKVEACISGDIPDQAMENAREAFEGGAETIELCACPACLSVCLTEYQGNNRKHIHANTGECKEMDCTHRLLRIA